MLDVVVSRIIFHNCRQNTIREIWKFQTNYFLCRESVDLTNDSDSDSSNERSSDDDIEVSTDSDSNSSIPGDPNEYYGGYGHCFNCGKFVMFFLVFEKFREIFKISNFQVVVVIGVLDVHTCDTICILWSRRMIYLKLNLYIFWFLIFYNKSWIYLINHCLHLFFLKDKNVPTI